MKKSLSALLLPLLACTVNAQNLLENGDFSAGTTAWTTDFRPTAQACTIAVEDETALLNRPAAAEFCRIYQDVPLESDAYYTIRYRRKAPAGVLSRVLLIQRNTAGEWRQDSPACLTDSSPEWTVGTQTVHVPADVNYGRFDLRLDTPGTLAVDDLSLSKATDAEIAAFQLRQEPDDFDAAAGWRADAQRRRVACDIAVTGDGERPVQVNWPQAPESYRILYHTAEGWLPGSQVQVFDGQEHFKTVLPASVTGLRIIVAGESAPADQPQIVAAK